MKIAFFTDVYQPTVNGVVVSIDSFADRLRSLGHSVTIFCPDYTEVPEEEVDVVRVPAVTFPAYKEYQMASPFSLGVIKHMRSSAYDVVHIHSPFAVGLAGIYFARRYRLPVIYTAHTDYAEYRHNIKGGGIVPGKFVDKVAAVFSNRIDATLAPSQKIADGLLQYGTKKPVIVLPSGIPRVVAGDAKRAKTRHGLEKGVLFLYLGRVTKEKNIDFLLEAFRLALPRLEPDSRLVIAGDGPYRETLERRAHDLELGERIAFIGMVKGQDKADIYAAADVFCHASHSETQGLTLGEAATYGLPLLISDDEAYTWIAEDSVNADLVSDDPSHYAERMITLEKDQALRKRYGTESLRKSKNLTIEAQTDKLLKVYEDAILAKRLAVLAHIEEHTEDE